jgi:hypothetical protein
MNIDPNELKIRAIALDLIGYFGLMFFWSFLLSLTYIPFTFYLIPNNVVLNLSFGYLTLAYVFTCIIMIVFGVISRLNGLPT